MGNTLTKLLNAGLFSLRGMSMSPTAKMRHDQEFKSEKRANVASAVAYLSVTGSLIFKDGRYVGMMTAKNYNKEMCFFITQFIRPDSSPAKALTWIDMSSPCGALTLERNVSRSNQITLHDVVEAENEPRPREKCVNYQDWFVAEMKAVEKELMKGDVVEVAKRFGLGTMIARPISTINHELNADRIDEALPVIAETELLSKCSLMNSSNVTRREPQDERIPVYYVPPLWPLLPQKDRSQEGFFIPFGPLKEQVLEYLTEMAQDSLDKSKPIPFPPPSLLNLEKGEVFQLKPPHKVSSTVSPRSKNLVASGENDLGLSDQGQDVRETVPMTVPEEICQNINSPTDHVQGITLFHKRQESNNHIHRLAREVRQSLKEEKAPENGTLLTIPASHDEQLDPTNPIYPLAKEVQQSLKEEEAAPENNTLLTIPGPASDDVQLEPSNPIYQLAEEVRQSMKGEEVQGNDPLLENTASNDVMFESIQIYQLAREVQQSLKDEKALENESLPTTDDSNDVKLESTNQIYQLAFEVRQSLKNEEAPENDTILTNPSSDNIQFESTDQIYKLAKEVRQSLKIKEAPGNEIPLTTLATNEYEVSRVDYNNNFIVHQARDFSQSHHDSTKSPLISPLSTVEHSPSTTLILLDNESDINIIRKLAMEVEEEINRALRPASPQKPLEFLASSKQQDLNNDQELSGKPDEEKSHAASKSQNETKYSEDEVEELYHLKSKELEIQLNKLKKTTETSGSAFPSSSGDSGRRGPFAAMWRRPSFDVTCRPGYRGISHRVTPTPSVKRVFRPGAQAPSTSSIKGSLIGPLPPAYPRHEYTRSGYRGLSHS